MTNIGPITLIRTKFPKKRLVRGAVKGIVTVFQIKILKKVKKKNLSNLLFLLLNI